MYPGVRCRRNFVAYTVLLSREARTGVVDKSAADGNLVREVAAAPRKMLEIKNYYLCVFLYFFGRFWEFWRLEVGKIGINFRARRGEFARLAII